MNLISGWRRACIVFVLSCLAGFSANAQQGGSGRAEYVLGAGDVVHIVVYQNPDLTSDVRVSEAGSISFPLVGAVKVGGLTTGQAERRIADALKSGNFVKQPQVSILVSQVRGNQASVLGQVNKPGRYALEVADMRLTDVLAMSGGVSPTGGDWVTVVGTRDGKPFRTEVDLPTVFAAGKRGEDLVVQNADVVWVDHAPMVYIYGEVQKPGAQRLERGMTVMQLLAAGGGLTQRGTEKGLQLRRRGQDGRIAATQPSMDDTLRDGDVVYVKESLF